MQERLDLPMGCYNEGALEMTHRMRKEYRDRCSRQNSHLNKNTDVFNRCLDVSDPVLADKIVKRASKYRQTIEQALASLPIEAQNLLEIPGGPEHPRQQTTDNNPVHLHAPNNERRNARAGVEAEEMAVLAINNEQQIAGADLAPEPGFMLGAEEEDEEVIYDDIEPEYDYDYRSDDEPMEEN